MRLYKYLINIIKSEIINIKLIVYEQFSINLFNY